MEMPMMRKLDINYEYPDLEARIDDLVNAVNRQESPDKIRFFLQNLEFNLDLYEQSGRISNDLAQILRKYYKEHTVDVMVQRSRYIPPETEQMLYHMAIEQEKKKSNIFVRILKGIGKVFIVCFKAWWALQKIILKIFLFPFFWWL